MNVQNRRVLWIAIVAGGGLAVGTLTLMHLQQGLAFDPLPRLARVAGWLATGLLGMSLLATPLRRWRHAFGVWRRPLGMASAMVAIVHVGATLLSSLRHAWEAVLTWPYIQAGLVVFSVMMALLLTSFPRFHTLLPAKTWKPLHRLVYFVVPLLIFHVLNAPQASASLPLVLIAGATTLLLARLPRPER